MAIQDRDGVPGYSRKKNHQLEKLVRLPGVYAVSFEDQWEHGSKTGPEGVTTLITNVPEVAKTIHKDLRQAELEEKESYTQKQAGSVLRIIAEGCRDEMSRQKKLLVGPTEGAKEMPQVDEEMAGEAREGPRPNGSLSAYDLGSPRAGAR